MLNWKKALLLLVGAFLISAFSSATTWWVLTHKTNDGSAPWKKTLQLTDEQYQKFALLETELDAAMKQIGVEEAENKVYLCTYLDTYDTSKNAIESATKKMAASYQKQQEQVASTLGSIFKILNPEQRKNFRMQLMHRVCSSCRNSTGSDKCLCGMCQH